MRVDLHRGAEGWTCRAKNQREPLLELYAVAGQPAAAGYCSIALTSITSPASILRVTGRSLEQLAKIASVKLIFLTYGV